MYIIPIHILVYSHMGLIFGQFRVPRQVPAQQRTTQCFKLYQFFDNRNICFEQILQHL